MLLFCRDEEKDLRAFGSNHTYVRLESRVATARLFFERRESSGTKTRESKKCLRALAFPTPSPLPLVDLDSGARWRLLVDPSGVFYPDELFASFRASQRLNM